MDPLAGAAMRVLSRAPLSSTLPTSPSRTPPSFTPSPPATCPPLDGIVAVGFVGSCSSTDLSQLINRILDSKTFGSGGLDKDLLGCNRSDWFRHRKVSYHFDAEKGIVFLQFSSLSPLESLSLSDSYDWVNGSVPELREPELEDLKGMLFMFSVCHVIIFVHDGLQFDTQILKKFRLLQTSRQALSPYIKFEDPRSNSISDPSPASTQTNTSFPQLGQRGHHATITGSNLSVSPGQSSPVILFVLQDNISDASTSVPTTDNSNFGKTDSGIRKRLIASLDAQLRFLMKKLHLSSRVTGKSSYPPLFSLDQSRAVTLIDRATNRRGEPLNFLTNLIDTSLTSKLAVDFLTNENTSRFTNNEEVQVIRDFIFRQSEMLRGHGGGAAGNSGSSSVSGVGMVAAAAIAAVTSSAAVKPVMGLQLPGLDNWLSVSTSILTSLTSSRISFTEGASDKSNNIEAALSFLERGTGVNTKFSISWCESALPVAREAYLQDLPPFYRTCTHKEHLIKALEAFRAAVKGPAVSAFASKLEKECNAIWEKGRQQCDVSSLTGKPCMLQRHNMGDSVITKHCSGYFFLHACACGRSRALRDDPFDFETANVKFSVLPKCEGLLPTVDIPSGDGASPVMASAWRLMRVGGSGYYKPEKGLLQMGFCTREKYLFQWKIRNSSDDDTIDQNLAAESSEIVREGREVHLNSNSKKQVAADLGINFGKGLPSSSTKKPFAEVVAGTVMTDTEFPALQKMHPKPSTGHKETKQNKSSGPRNETRNGNKIFSGDIQIGSNVVPVISKDEESKENKSMQEFIVFIGFEHECPHGHRFLLSEKHLKGFDSPFLSERGHGRNLGNKKGFPTKVLQSSMTKANKTKEVSVKHSSQSVGMPGTANENGKCREGGRAFSLLNRKLPIFMNCPHCGQSEKQDSQKIRFAGTISQLQRIFIVTPPFPVLLATCPVVQFEDSCLPESVSNREQQSRFGFGSRVMLPPDSFLTLKLPFIYGVKTDESSLYPLNLLDGQPERTAWLVEGTALQLVSIGNFPAVV